MDWLSNQNLISTFIMGFKRVEHSKPKGANSLPFDYKDTLSQMLVNLQTDLKRIAYHKMTKTAKSNDESSKLRAIGNKWFSSSASDALDKALEFYTKSIAFALLNSEEMALSYANRSAVLFKMNCPQECLENIERALLNYPENLLSKLYDRQAQCYSQLAEECKMEAKVWLDKVPAKDSSRVGLKAILKDCPEKKLQNFVIYNDCVVPEIKNPSKRYSCASDAIGVQYSEEFGKHIVANRDVDVGEVLIVEKPYFRFLDKNNLYTHCSFCMTFLWNGIPCDECVNMVYCSEGCKKKAWIEYHQMECTVFDLIIKYNDFGISDKTECIRLLLQMHHEAGGLQQLKERVANMFDNNLDALKLGVQDEWYQGVSLESILCLISHEDKVTQMEFQSAAVSSFRILFYLLTCTDFFQVKFNRDETYDVDIIQSMSKNLDFIFYGRLIVKLLCIIHRNSFMSSELTETESKGLGKVTAGLPSLLNNNCYPNTCNQFAKDHMVLYAEHPIKKGEQIFTCYCDYYYAEDRRERQQFFNKFYFFKCNCIACIEYWPKHFEDIPKYIQSIESIWKRCQSSDKLFMELPRAVFGFGHYGCIEELFISLHKIIPVIYEELGVNSMEMRIILKILNQSYLLTGNVRKYRDLSAVFM